MRTYVKEYFKDNIIEYSKLLIITIIGIVIAIIAINNTNSTGREEIREIINNKINNIRKSQDIDKNQIFIRSIQNNTKEFVAISLLSTTIVGLPIAYFIIIKKAFAIGYTISAIFATQSVKTSILFICNGLIVHNIIYLIGIFMAIVAGENLLKKIIKNKNEIKIEIIRFLFFVIISILMISISSLIEAYVTTYFFNVLKKYI